MIDGVTILNQFEVVTKTSFNWSSCWTGVFIALGLSLIVSIIFGLKENDIVAGITIFIVMTLLLPTMLGFMFGEIIFPKPIAYETHYEVTINDNVSMNDFYDKYELIEQRGKIYTVKEINSN